MGVSVELTNFLRTGSFRSYGGIILCWQYTRPSCPSWRGRTLLRQAGASVALPPDQAAGRWRNRVAARHHPGAGAVFVFGYFAVLSRRVAMRSTIIERCCHQCQRCFGAASPGAAHTVARRQFAPGRTGGQSVRQGMRGRRGPGGRRRLPVFSSYCETR